MVDANYEKLIYLARITEQAERHEETIKYMEEIVKTKKEDLTVEERNILSAAFKNCVSARRSAWRSIYGVEVKEKTKTLEEEFAEYGRCIGGGCHQCKFYDICPTGQMSEY